MSEFKFKAWPTEYLSINQHFGANPHNYAQFGLPGHEGVDIMAPSGSKVFAVADGTVSFLRKNPAGHNYGIHVRIDHQDDFQTIYAHLQEIHVRTGQRVKAGELLGLADDTGNSFGSHLHLSLKRKNHSYKNWPFHFFDPTPYLLPLMGWQRPSGPYINGWAYTSGITIINDLAQANTGGINLRKTPSIAGKLIDLVPGGSIMIVMGRQQNGYTPVQIPIASLSNVPDPEVPPPPPPSELEETVNGWAWTNYLTPIGNSQAVVGRYGINLRVAAKRTAENMGLVKGGSTVIIIGAAKGQYTPVRVRRRDFSGPVHLPKEDTTPPPAPPEPAKNTVLGWGYTQNLTIDGRQAISGRYGTNLRSKPRYGPNKEVLALFVEGGIAEVAGLAEGGYTPLRVPRHYLQKVQSPLPKVQKPKPFPEDKPPEPPAPTPDTTPGWAFTAAVEIEGGTAVAGPYGINLRNAPRRDADNKGFVPAGTPMTITGQPAGEYTPVRVDDAIIQPPYDPSKPPKPGEQPPPITEPPILGSARIGLHASADPGISQAEIEEFKAMRPGMIKVMSLHDPNAVKKLSQNHPDAKWIVRAFLAFEEGGRVRSLSPARFVKDTLSDVKRTLKAIGKNYDVVVELHNEPNLVPEGLTGAWRDGATFADWWLDVLARYRKALPDMRFIYPGLSPGSAVTGLKQDHVQFIEASRKAVEAADGLGIHLYWSNVYPMEWSLNVLDDYISRFRYKPIWVTEASNNKSGTPVYKKAQQYLKFWQELQKRPTVQGVTYFVASASNPAFKEEVWVGRGIGRLVGRR